MNTPKILLYFCHDILYLNFGPGILVKHIASVPLPNFSLQFSYKELVMLDNFLFLLQRKHNGRRQILATPLLDWFWPLWWRIRIKKSAIDLLRWPYGLFWTDHQVVRYYGVLLSVDYAPMAQRILQATWLPSKGKDAILKIFQLCVELLGWHVVNFYGKCDRIYLSLAICAHFLEVYFIDSVQFRRIRE
jgi:hypothetical protein